MSENDNNVEQSIDFLLDILQQWTETKDIEVENSVKLSWESSGFSFPNSVHRLLHLLNGRELGLGYRFQFIESSREIFRTINYTESFCEFYRLTNLIPILNHGDGRSYNLYDGQTNSIIQFSILDSPSEWIVLSNSFDDSIYYFYDILKSYKQGIPLPQSIYQRINDSGQSITFKKLKTTFPNRAIELDAILPRPLVLRTHQAGTWQIEISQTIHLLIKNNSDDDIIQLKVHLENYPQDIRLKNSKKLEPIHTAAAYGRINCLKYLLEYIETQFGIEGVKQVLSARDVSLQTPLIIACSRLHGTNTIKVSECINLILSYGPEIVDVNVCQNEGQTPLHLISSFGFPYFVNKLIQMGANVHKRNNDEYGGYTPLHSLCNCRGGSIEDSGLNKIVENINFDPHQRSCIYSLKLLLNAGANINSETNELFTPLHLMMWGSGWDNSLIIEYLCEMGANVNARNNRGISVIDSGFAREKYSTILLRYGAIDDHKNELKEINGEVYVDITKLKRYLNQDFIDTSVTPILTSTNAIMGFTANEVIEKFNLENSSNKKLKDSL